MPYKILSSMLLWALLPAAALAQTDEPEKVAVYDCDAELRFTVSLKGDSAFLFLPEETLEFTRVPSASGAKFADGEHMFWSKGESAMLSYRGRQHTDCRLDRRASIWERAKLGGADFRAVGNEPGWHLEIGPKAITLVSDYGASAYRFPLVEPRVDQQARQSVYSTRTESHTLSVTLEGRQCRDDMSGEPFETTVILDLDGKTMRGCGRALH